MMKLKIDGMTCEHCVKAVSRAASRIPGVERVRSIDLKVGELVVEGSPDVDALVREIEGEGYAARWLE